MVSGSSQLADSSGRRPVAGWPAQPHGVSFCGDATSVAVDSDDNVYVFNRGTDPLAIFDSSGTFVGSWGAGEFDRPHGIAIDAEDNLWLVDHGHFVQKRTREGEVLLTLGKRGKPADAFSGFPFNLPTDVAIHPSSGEIFVADGYQNSAIHRFDGSGRHITSWGGVGEDPGQFCCPHGICIVDEDVLVVCDRENFRLQFFSTSGEFIEQWHMFRPSAVRAVAPAGEVRASRLIVGQMGPPQMFHGERNLGNRVSVLDPETGHLCDRFGAATLDSGVTSSPHHMGSPLIRTVPSTSLR